MAARTRTSRALMNDEIGPPVAYRAMVVNVARPRETTSRPLTTMRNSRSDAARMKSREIEYSASVVAPKHAERTLTPAVDQGE